MPAIANESLRCVLALVTSFTFLITALPERAAADELASVQQLDFEPRDEERDRIVPLRIYLQTGDSPQPIVLFSHGLGGSREGNPYLGRHWAANGYICVFMQHSGSDRDVWQTRQLRQRMDALKQAANARSSQDRFNDVPFVIDQLEKWNREQEHVFHNRLDTERIGMSGHSYGAVTTLAVAGRKFPLGKSYPDPRIDAFLALSPSLGFGVPPDRAFGKLKQPILCMTGTKDDSQINPQTTPESRREVFKALPAGDKYELVFDGGHHFTFSDSGGFRRRDRDPKHHPAIQQISLQFWNAYLKNKASAKRWLQSDQPRADCELKEADVWQWK